MKFLAMILLFTGYTLVYAAVAKKGEFATDPWLGIIGDAYTNTNGSSDGSSDSSGTGLTQSQVESQAAGQPTAATPPGAETFPGYRLVRLPNGQYTEVPRA